jgi:chromosome segregation ATPase
LVLLLLPYHMYVCFVQWEASAAATASQLSELQSAEAGLSGQLQQLGSQVDKLQAGATAAAEAVEALQQQVQVSRSLAVSDLKQAYTIAVNTCTSML